MKLNIPVRIKNFWFWVGLGGVILTAMGISPEMLTSWDAVAAAGKELISNPYMLGSTVFAVMGVILDPTTAGPGDSKQALSYRTPYKEAK